MEYATQILFAVLLAIPIACIVWTFTQEDIFKDVREALRGYQKRHADSWWRCKLSYLPTCPFCFSHYVAGAFVALFNFPMLVGDWRGYVVSLFTLVLISNLYVSLYNLLRVNLRRAKAQADWAEVDLARAQKLPPANPARPRLRAAGGPRRNGKGAHVEA